MENNHPRSRTREVLANDLSTLKRDIAQIGQDMKAYADAQVEATRQLVNAKIQAVRESINHRPLTMLCAGFVLGYLFAARRKK